MGENSGRLHYFDNLKTGVILLIVTFHCAMCYMKYAPDWWYVLDGQESLSFTCFVIWADNFIMPIMFFISGFFGLKSLRIWPAGAFWLKKLHRIGLPWLIGMIFFVPWLIWLWFYSRDIPISFYNLIFEQYLGPFYQQSVYWYLSSLLALYLLLFCLVRLFPVLSRKRTIPPTRFPYLLLPIYILAMALPMFALNLHYPDETWVNICYLFMLQITRVPVYIASFLLGAWCERERLLNFMERQTDFFLICLLCVFAICSILFLLFRLTYNVATTFDILLNALVHCSFCALSLFTAICSFRKFLNFTSPLITKLASMSYAIYFVHENIVQSVVLAIRPLRIQIFVHYALAVTISLLLCLLLCRLFLHLSPRMRFF